MIPKVKTGNSFSGVLEYSLKEGKQAEIIDKNMFGETAQQLEREFRMVADVNTRAEKKVKHFILSFAEGDRTKLTPEKLTSISREFIEGMGYKDNQYATIRHGDTNHEHLHIIVNRINMSTFKAVKDGKEKYIGSKLARQLEKKYGLTQVSSVRQVEKQPGKEEREMKQRLKEEDKPSATDKEAIKAAVHKAIRGSRNIEGAIPRIKAAGIGMEFSGNKKGDITGWKFKYKDREYKASTIDRNLSWGKVKEQFNNNQSKGISL